MSEKFLPAIEFRNPKDLIPNPRNARTHSQKQLHQLMASIREFQTITPLFVDPKGVVLAGHARLQAARNLGLETVPVIVVAHLDELQKRAFMLADNQIALQSGWDEDILKAEFLELSNPALDLDISITGFSTPQIDMILGIPEKKEKANPLDRVEAIDRSRPAITKLGELWSLGTHRLFVGDALAASSYEALMQGEVAHQVLSDPPYNVKIDGHVGGLGRVHHAEFPSASGEMTGDEFREFLLKATRAMATNAKDGAILMIFMDWRHVSDILGAGRATGLELKNIVVWDKINGGMGSLYRSQHEMVLIFKSGTAPHTNNIELGRHGRYRTNIWRYAGASMFHRGRETDLETHPTVKPVTLLMDAIKDCSKRGEIILDPFGGSGSTLLAAERTGRRARLIELDPYYADATIRRWQGLTGKAALNAATEKTFAEVERHASHWLAKLASSPVNS